MFKINAFHFLLPYPVLPVWEGSHHKLHDGSISCGHTSPSQVYFT